MFLESLLKIYARHFPIDRGKYRIVERFWERAAGNGNRMRKAKLNAGGFAMDCDISKALQRQFYFFGTYFLERDHLACWSEDASGATTIFDVGANLGIYSLTAAAANPGAEIHAFEPTPQLAAHLGKTLSDNGLTRIRVVEAAVSGSTGTAVLNLWGSEEEGNEGLNFVTDSARAAHSLPVTTVSLDDYCEREGITRVDLLKLDIQGNEAEALRGADHLLREGRIARIYTELNWSAEPGPCPASEVIEILERHGYRFTSPGSNQSPQPKGPWLHSLSDIVATFGH